MNKWFGWDSFSSSPSEDMDGVDADADVGVGIGDNAVEIDGIGSCSVAPPGSPFPSKTSPRGDLPFRSQQPTVYRH